jgi:hypothetical protein
MQNNLNNSNFQRLEKAACINSYKTEFVSARSNVVLVSTTLNSTNAFYYLTSSVRSYVSPYDWMCFEGDCNSAGTPTSSNTWTVANKPVDYCLSEVVDEKCKLQFSLYIMIVVIFCNFVKSVSMALTLFQQRTPTLVTLGDAVASFLDFPDPSTEGMCIVSKAQILKGAWKQRRTPKSYRPKRHFWFRAASLKRWLVCNILYANLPSDHCHCVGSCLPFNRCAAALAGTGALLQIGINGLSTNDGSLSELYKIGVGAVTASSLINIGLNGLGARDLLANVLLANLPQAILSFLYLMYNGIFTCMVSADEWSGFAHQRKTLRVTSPVGKQRTSYYLQLPYKFALPLLLLSGILHWLVSQSIFLARVTIFNPDGDEDDYQSISTCGYSCIAIIFVIIVGGIAVLSGLGFGFRRYPAEMPLAAGCSAAISAACHPPLTDEDASVLPVKWGAVPTNNSAIGHCSFSCNVVSSPVPGEQYAGELKKRKPPLSGNEI